MDLIQYLRRLAVVDEEWDEKAPVYQQARERLTNSQELDERRQAQADIEQTAADNHAHLANLELEIDSLRTHSQQVQHALYGGGVVSPRELENLRRDADQLGNRISQLEDQALELLGTCDDLDAQAADGRTSLESFEREWEQGTAAARETYQVLRARLQALQRDREQLRSHVPPRELALYDELRRTKGGHPLAPMKDGTCQVCRVMVPRNKVTIAEGGQDAVATCEGCGRILYQA